MATENGSRNGATATPNSQLQLIGFLVHGLILILLIAATTALTATNHFTADAAIGVFGSIAGFSGSAASYRAGVRHGDAGAS